MPKKQVYLQQEQAGGLNGFTPVRNFPTGYGRRGRVAETPARRLYEARVAEAVEFLADVLEGSTPYYFLLEAIAPSSEQMAAVVRSHYPRMYREGMSVSDFPNLTGDVLDRMLLARFNEAPSVWRQYIPVRSRPLRDFRTVKNIKTDGGNAYWEKLTEWDGLDYTKLDETPYTYDPALYGRAQRLSFQAIMNDDLSAFDDIPRILGQGGRATLSRFATSLLFDASGPKASFFTAGNGNLLSGNPALTITSLGTAIQQILGFQDSEGIPIGANGLRLVYGPGLHVTAQNILNQLSVDVSGEAGGTAGQRIRVNNWLVADLVPVMDPYIPIVASTANGATSWLVVQAPNVGRPIAEVGFLNGFQTPQLFRRAGDTATVAGGVNQMLGAWATMAQEYKGVIGYGGVEMEPKAGVGSNGSG